jgi:septal ring factor EnvC (AmiA/AmiB activator)
VLGAFLLNAEPTRAQESEETSTPKTKAEELQELKDRLSTSRERERELSTEEQRLKSEIDGLKKKSVSIAAQIQAQEAELSRLEGERDLLERREFELRAELDSQHDRLSRILGVLERMSRTPPPALLVQPQDATAAARSAMMLSAVVPFVESEAAKLGGTLAEIMQVRRQSNERSAELATENTELAMLRAEIGETTDALGKLVAQTTSELKSERQKLRQMADEAESLTALIEKIEKAKAEVAPEPERSDAPVIVMSEAAAAAGMQNSLKGTLLWPANGWIKGHFNEGSSRSGKYKGIVVAARPGAQVVSPVDGRIEFADVYRAYGNLLIISTGKGYHILLAGLERIDGAVGQWLIAGEPVGVMGPGVAGEERAGKSGESHAELYIELQKNGVAIDPLPWFSNQGKVSG